MILIRAIQRQRPAVAAAAASVALHSIAAGRRVLPPPPSIDPHLSAWPVYGATTIVAEAPPIDRSTPGYRSRTSRKRHAQVSFPISYLRTGENSQLLNIDVMTF